MELEKNLEKLGLSSQEAKVYISCIKLGNAKASTIAAYAKIERQAVYYTLTLLMKKGFVTENIKSGVQYYTSINPYLLLEKIEEEHLEKEEAIKALSEEYQHLSGIALSHPKVEQYTGLEGFKTILRELISTSDQEIYSYNSEKVIEFQPYFLAPYMKKRKERKIKVKTLVEKTPKTLKHKKENTNLLREMQFTHLLNGKDYSMAISKDKVIFVRVNAKEQIGIKIQDASFAELQANIFKLVWKMTKDISK